MGKAKINSVQESKRLFEASSEERRKIFRALCLHVRAGYSVDCFSKMSEQRVFDCLKLYKEEFILEEFEQAMREGKQGWEQIGRRQANGECLGNSRSWFYNMAQRYKWSDRVQVESDNKHAVSVNIVSYASQQASQGAVDGVQT